MFREEAKSHRAMVARYKFLGCDRPDIQYAAKQASRSTIQQMYSQSKCFRKLRRGTWNS